MNSFAGMESFRVLRCHPLETPEKDLVPHLEDAFKKGNRDRLYTLPVASEVCTGGVCSAVKESYRATSFPDYLLKLCKS